MITYSGIVEPSPLEFKCLKGNFAFGDVRLRTNLKDIDSKEWTTLQSDESDWKTSGDIDWRKSDSGGIVIGGNGSIILPLTNSGFSSVRFDCKINGEGNAIILIGDIELTISTSGDYKTGSINGYPIKANLVDQSEWCTLEINQDNGTVVYLNDIPITTINDAPTLTGDTLRIKVNDAELTIRKTYLSN
jgi:hypothetical protein